MKLVLLVPGKTYNEDRACRRRNENETGEQLVQCAKEKRTVAGRRGGKLGVSRQTISKWETDETLPDICQSKKLADLYGVSLDELIEYDVDEKEIQDMIDQTDDKVSRKVNWNRVWSRKYPVLAAYQKEVDLAEYAEQLGRLLDSLKKEYGYGELDAMLVLKDILASVWKKRS